MISNSPDWTDYFRIKIPREKSAFYRQHRRVLSAMQPRGVALAKQIVEIETQLAEQRDRLSRTSPALPYSTRPTATADVPAGPLSFAEILHLDLNDVEAYCRYWDSRPPKEFHAYRAEKSRRARMART